MRAIDKELDFEYIDDKIKQSILNAKEAKLIKIKSPGDTYTTAAIEGENGEKIQDHFLPLYWYGSPGPGCALICEHQKWVNDEFDRVLGLGIGQYCEWMSKDDPSEGGWVPDYGSVDFQLLFTLNNNQLGCAGSIAEAIWQTLFYNR